MSKYVVCILIFTACCAWAAGENTPSDSTPLQLQASWREAYTVGPGDSFRIELYGKPETTRLSVIVEPDGTLSYLQAQNIPVNGLTINEVRDAVQKTLDKYYKNVEVMVQPVLLASKHYFVLGRVNNKGSYILDHPTTVMEAIAFAGGFESGVLEPTSSGLADLSRSFLVRDGKRVDVNFEKLFLQGDFSQNVELEPNDYLFFPSVVSHEVYVLGALSNPGKLNYVPGVTVMASIASAGSFNKSAFRDRVLVIRGSLNNPETFAIDCNDILKGRAPDFKLQPKDIVYVSTRPWKIAEDLLDSAVTSFVRSAVNAWAGSNIILGREVIIPQIEP
jgi:protein involved in polysaccharide export with SLBB domain